MRTTVTLSDEVFHAAKREAERRGKTLSALVEEAVRGCLASGAYQPASLDALPELPTSETSGGIREEFAGRPMNEVFDELDQADLMERFAVHS
jgi:hypothetical protein